ncbi:MAG: hypothetical protein HY592_00895 [Candidatus Omnitrophica bacterium]|nr:hypothetical protein [Candidatus Omnitrophota bacterium]
MSLLRWSVATLTKSFSFSASFARDGKIYGHNYTLEITIDHLSFPDETAMTERVEESLIKKLQSRDLGLHVDFLKGIEIDEKNLLARFWPIVEKAVSPARLYSATLRRDSRTQVTLHAQR